MGKIKYYDETERITRNVAIDDAGCWRWQLMLSDRGYPYVGDETGKKRRAHRYAYELFVGPIPDGLTLDHLCKVRDCVNPAHLEPVTQRENSRRSPYVISSVHASRTHCPRSHPYSADNTYVTPSTGQRKCRTCRRDQSHARRLVAANIQTTEIAA